MSSAVLARFVGRRLLAAALVLVVVSVVVFAFVHLAPGGPEQTIGGRTATPAQLAEIRADYGLDDPLPVQYWRFASDAVRLDFGDSFSTRESVVTSIREGLKISAPLVLVSFVLITVIGTALGTLAAYRSGRASDRALMGASLLGASSPPFVTAIILLSLFGVQLGWLPTFGDGDGFAERLQHLILPIATLTIAGVAAMLQITRTRVKEVLREDHVTFATARGLRPRYVVGRSVLRNAGIQIVTQSGTILVALVAGGILVEETFGLNGTGALLMSAIEARDVPVIQGVTLLIAAFILLINLVVDLLYFVLDPRVRAQAQRLATAS